MSSGVTRKIVGQVVGTGSLLTVSTIGFRPRVVKLYNQTSRLGLDWQESMADNSGAKTVAAGTRTHITTQAITPLATGFSVGTDAVNAAGNIMHYVAEE